MVWAAQSLTTGADVPQYSIPDGLVTVVSADFSAGQVAPCLWFAITEDSERPLLNIPSANTINAASIAV